MYQSYKSTEVVLMSRPGDHHQWVEKEPEMALLMEELGSRCDAVVARLKDGTEILAARILQGTSVLLRDYDFAGVELTDDVKAAFLSGEKCLREILCSNEGVKYKMCHVSGAKGWGFEVEETSGYMYLPELGLTADALGYTGEPYEGREPLDDVLARMPEENRATAEKILRPLEEDYQAAMSVLGFGR
jgi:hypothetical protein